MAIKFAVTSRAIMGFLLSKNRKAKGMTQTDVARVIDLSVSVWSRVENGHISLQLDYFIAVSRAMRVSPGSLLEHLERSEHTLRDRGVVILDHEEEDYIFLRGSQLEALLG